MDSHHKQRVLIKKTAEKIDEFIFESCETINKLANEKVYEKEDIEDSVKRIFKHRKYDKDNFAVIDDGSYDKIETKACKTSEETPIFFVYEKTEGQWIFFFIIKRRNKYTVFYKDSSGSEILPSIRDHLDEKLCNPKIVVHTAVDHDEEDSHLYGPFCLRNVKKVLELWQRKGKKFGEKKFTNMTFCKQTNILEDRGNIITKFVGKLATKKIFTNELREFLKQSPLELHESASGYLKILEEEVEKEDDEINEKKINEAREKFMDQKKLKEYGDRGKKIVEEKDEKFEIEKEYPDEMKQLKLIFRLLGQNKIDVALYNTLNSISKMLQVDYKKLEPYYENLKRQESPRDKNILPDDINDLAKKVKDPFPPETEGLTPVDQLIEEIELLSEEDKTGILKKFYLVKKMQEKWKGADIIRIKSWATGMKGKLGHDDNEICETVAIMNSVILALNRFNLRDIQILAVLVFLHSRSGKGRLCQIQTGEGKTFIVSLLAVIRVLQGHTVDVITSNAVLAQDGVDECKEFYSVFDVTVATNSVSEGDTPRFKRGYKADIVYGSISNFQFDYLRDTFEGLRIRGERKFGQVILDEVDSMLVDNGGHIAKLAEPFPGMECLRYVYIKIWQELHKAETSFVDEVSSTIQKFMKEYPDKEEGKRLAEEFLRVATETEEGEIKDRLRKSQILESITIIPKHLQEYVRGKLSLWINNAAHAKYRCHENKQYRIIKNDQDERVIVPVDYQNTGITMKNTIWSNGLHQFVQLKHNVFLSFESMTSSFISNLGYIKLYEENNLYLFGMTGTLGSEAEQQLISDVYSVDYARLPTFKKKNFKELHGLVFEDDRWHVELIITILKIVDKGRAILVVCETVQDLNKLEKKLECLHKEKINVRIFANEESAGETKVKVQPGDIILATNIAGRGTNFKTSKILEKNGGLHVCVGFLPNNKRVEDQAFGRTSRKGNNGTAQLIIRQSEVEKLEIREKKKTTQLALRQTEDEELEINEENLKFDLIKEERDKLERKRLGRVKTTLVKELIFKDELFGYFSVKHRELKKKSKKDRALYYALRDLKEVWALWLEKKNFKIDNIRSTRAVKEFDEFLEEYSDIVKGDISHNPFYRISLAEYYLQDVGSTDSSARKKAQSHLETAISMGGDNNILAGAHLKLFEISVEGGEQLLDRFKRAIKEIFFITPDKNEDYRSDAKRHLESAKQAVRKELNYFEQYLIREDGNQLNSDFQQILTQEDSELLQHLLSKHNCLKMHEKFIEDLWKQVDESDGIAIQGKEEIQIPDALHEVIELQGIGLDTLYAIRKVYDVSSVVIDSSRIQIVVGIASIAAGLAFFPIFPIMSAIGAPLISEGIIDIVMEVLSKGDKAFDKKDYVKGKFISYGISLLTGGLSAIASSAKILTKAVNACRKFSKLLKNSPILKDLSNGLARIIEKVGKNLSEILEKINSMKHIVPKSRVTLVKDLVKKTAVTTEKRLVKSIIREKVTKPLLSMTIDKILDEVYKIVGATFKEAMKIKESLMEKLRTSSIADIKAAVSKFMESDFIRATCERVAKKLLGILHNSALNVVFAAINWVKEALQLATFKNEFIAHLQDTLPGGDANNDVDKVIEDVSMEGAKTMISLFKDFIKGFKGVYTFDVKKALKSGKQLAHPLEILKVSLDANMEEINEKMRRLALEGTIDKNDYNTLHGLIQSVV